MHEKQYLDLVLFVGVCLCLHFHSEDWSVGGWCDLLYCAVFFMIPVTVFYLKCMWITNGFTSGPGEIKTDKKNLT